MQSRYSQSMLIYTWEWLPALLIQLHLVLISTKSSWVGRAGSYQLLFAVTTVNIKKSNPLDYNVYYTTDQYCEVFILLHNRQHSLAKTAKTAKAARPTVWWRSDLHSVGENNVSECHRNTAGLRRSHGGHCLRRSQQWVSWLPLHARGAKVPELYSRRAGTRCHNGRRVRNTPRLATGTPLSTGRPVCCLPCHNQDHPNHGAGNLRVSIRLDKRVLRISHVRGYQAEWPQYKKLCVCGQGCGINLWQWSQHQSSSAVPRRGRMQRPPLPTLLRRERADMCSLLLLASGVNNEVASCSCS